MQLIISIVAQLYFSRGVYKPHCQMYIDSQLSHFYEYTCYFPWLHNSLPLILICLIKLTLALLFNPQNIYKQWLINWLTSAQHNILVESLAHVWLLFCLAVNLKRQSMGVFQISSYIAICCTQINYYKKQSGVESKIQMQKMK